MEKCKQRCLINQKYKVWAENKIKICILTAYTIEPKWSGSLKFIFDLAAKAECKLMIYVEDSVYVYRHVV